MSFCFFCFVKIFNFLGILPSVAKFPMNIKNINLISHILKIRIVRTDLPMVPEVRIELTADPYQGSVLPLNYTGV